MPCDADICEERVRIEGNQRTLEGVLAYPFDSAPTRCVLIAGPHPLLGGDFHNNVVRALLQGLAAGESVVLAFNYGGIGQSEGGPADWPAVTSQFWRDGTFDEERDWVEDTAAAVAALRRWCDRPLVMIGYSFGCWTVSRQLGQGKVRAVVMISPNPKRHCLDGLRHGRAPLLVIHSDNDFTCSGEECAKWFQTLGEPKRRVLLSAGEHFFRGREPDLVRAVTEFLAEHCEEPVVCP